MSFFLLISLGLAPVVQDRAVPYTAEVYAPPPVRPFEPPSSFGRVTAEGDGSADPRRRPIVVPVVVEAYSRSYEHSPSGADSAYDRGVDNAEAAMDARMGPLDGLWRLRDVDGRLVMQLALMDRGPGRPLQGAFRKVDATAGPGPVDVAMYEAGRLSLILPGGWLDLTQTAGGWAGTLVENGTSRAVALAR